MLFLSNIYNIITFCCFIGFAGFPMSAWLCAEFIMEVLLMVDFILRLLFLKCFREQWDQMMFIRNVDDKKLKSKIRLFVSSIPTSIIIYGVVPHTHLSNVWLALFRALKLVRIHQLKQYFDIRDLRNRRSSYLRTLQAALYILLVSHALGCFWLFVGRVDPSKGKGWFDLEHYEELHAPDI